MRIFVEARPLANKNEVEKIDEANFIVSVKEPPIKGRANKAILQAISKFFNVPMSNVRIISGLTSRKKVVEIYQNKLN